MIKKYYSAQKAQSLLFLTLGFLAITVAIFTILKPNEIFNWGFGVPFGIIGLVQLWYGYNTFSKTKTELEFALNAAKNNVNDIKKLELVKINTIKKNYSTKNYILLGLNVVSIVLLIGFSSFSILKGIGLALFVQSLLHISSLYFENNRTEIYLKWLNDYYN